MATLRLNVIFFREAQKDAAVGLAQSRAVRGETWIDPKSPSVVQARIDSINEPAVRQLCDTINEGQRKKGLPELQVQFLEIKEP